MNPPTSDSTGQDLPEAPDKQVNRLDPLPGFALPQSALHSIPLPVEFLTAVDEATKANRVKSILPKFFNPLFRKQGVVNKLSLEALSRVGESLKQLSEEIGLRDRLIEKLAEHINKQGSHNQQHHLKILEYCRKLEDHLDQLATSSQTTEASLHEATTRMRAEISTLVRAIEIDEGSLLYLQGNAAAMQQKAQAIEDAQNHLSREVAAQQANLAGISAVADALDSRLAATESQVNRSSQAQQGLASTLQSLQQRLQSMQDELNALQPTVASLTQVALSLQEEQKTQQARFLETIQQLQAAGATLRSDLEQQLSAIETRHQAEIAATTQAQAALAQQLQAAGATLRSDLEQHLAHVENKHRAEIAAATQDQAALAQQLQAAAATLRSDLEQHLAHVENKHRAEIAHLAQSLSAERATIAGIAASVESQGNHHSAEIGELRSEVAILRQDQAEFLQRWQAALAGTRHRAKQRGAEPMRAQAADQVTPERQRRFDAMYLAFENRFRGSREMISERLGVNLGILARAEPQIKIAPGVRWPDRPDAPSYNIVDLGCGRGEWLEVIAGQGHRALGVDTNTYFIAECRERGLAVADSDAIAFLRTVPDRSLAMVSGFHIIEHLTLPQMLELISETHRVLVKGGTALFETPNCKNLTVGAANFYSDPTHQKPVFPETAQFLFKYAGFAEAKIDYRLADEGSPFGQDKPDQMALRGLLSGPRDYAVIAIK